MIVPKVDVGQAKKNSDFMVPNSLKKEIKTSPCYSIRRSPS
jgi:hypothetical protein